MEQSGSWLVRIKVMKLKKLLKDLPVEIRGTKDLEISGISNNSKRVVPGHLFLARKGQKFNACEFIEEAIHNGAHAILCAHYNPFIKNITQIVHPAPQDLESQLASRFYEDPSSKLRLIAITGTNGKTTVSSIIQQCLHHIYSPGICGLIGTVGYDTGKAKYSSDHTTPDNLTLQKMLREMVENGCQFCSLEATSHGLVQKRLADLQIHVGIFNNLARDHLDYHHTMEEYAMAKSLLFNSDTYAKHMHTAIINSDDPYAEEMIRAFRGKIIRCGSSPKADLRLIKLENSPRESIFSFTYQGRTHTVHTSLVGHHNALNCLVCIAALLSENIDLEKILGALPKIQNVRGRLERIPTPHGIVYVDYAHKPGALENVLATLKNVHPKARLTCVFGCGGDRDIGKRPMMGQIAQQYSDRIIVTSDNPRSEQPEAIIAQITAGMSHEKPYEIEPDRRLAIAKAIQGMAPGDVVLVAGKGHETYQLVGSRILSFDDAQVVKESFHGRT